MLLNINDHIHGPRVKVTWQSLSLMWGVRNMCYDLNIALKVHNSFSHFSDMFYDPEGVYASLQGNLPL